MAEPEDTRIRTYEDLVMDRIGKMFAAKDTGDGYLFDEIIDEVDMLFKLVPDLGRDFEKVREIADTEVRQALSQIEAEAATIEDDITRDVVKTQKTGAIKWEYRSDLLEAILTILDEYQMIPFVNPPVGELTSDEEIASFEPTEDEKQIPPPPPAPQERVPVPATIVEQRQPLEAKPPILPPAATPPQPRPPTPVQQPTTAPPRAPIPQMPPKPVQQPVQPQPTQPQQPPVQQPKKKRFGRK